MNKFIVYAILFFITIGSFGQQTTSAPSVTGADYLKKSKNQKTAAWILLAGGATLIGTGLLVGDREESSFNDAAAGGIVAGIGVVAAIASIPLFVASNRNKRKATNASTYFEMRRMPVQSGTAFTFRAVPALTFRLNL